MCEVRTWAMLLFEGCFREAGIVPSTEGHHLWYFTPLVDGCQGYSVGS